jgi:hypothetical protein
LIRVVSIEGVGVIDPIRFGPERAGLVLDANQRGGVVNGTVLVVVIADRAVKLVVPENHIHGRAPGRLGSLRIHHDFSAVFYAGGASSDQFTVYFYLAGVAGLNGSQLGVVANVRETRAMPINDVDQ